MSSLVRPATIADLPAILQLEHATPEAPHWPEADYAAMLTPGPVRRCLFVATDDGELIGFAAARAIAAEADLETIAVAPNHRRQGAATALCRAILHWCQTEGASTIQLEVRASSLGAQHLYRNLGFTTIGRRPLYYRHPDDDAILMHRQLAGNP